MRRKPRILHGFLILTSLGLGAGIGYYGWYSQRVTELEKPELPAEAASKHARKPTRPAELDLAATLDRGDYWLRHDRPDQALRIYHTAMASAPRALGPGLQLRLGLCHESLEHWDEALAAYAMATASAEQTAVTRVATVARGRVFLRSGQAKLARDLLANVLLGSSGPSGDPHLQADARFLIALATAFDQTPVHVIDPFTDAPIGPSLPRWWDDPLEGLSESSPPATPRSAGDGPVMKVEATTEGQRKNVRVTARQTNKPVREFLDELASQFGQKPHWSEQAQESAKGRALNLDFVAMDVNEAIPLIAEPAGLVWLVESDTWQFRSESELAADELATSKRLSLRRTLQKTLADGPDHYLAPAAALLLGNLEFRAHRLQEARQWYERANEALPRNVLTVESAYNLGLTLRRLERFDAAAEGFYKAIDTAPAHEIAMLAWFRVGQLHLHQAEYARAARAFRKAAAAPSTPDLLATAILHQAVGELLAGNPRAANNVLWDARDRLQEEKFRPYAVFLDTLARHRLQLERRSTSRYTGDLITAVVALPPSGILGVPGDLLAGQAYRDLGMDVEMTGVYERALKEARGPLAEEMSYRLAEARWNQGNTAVAERLFAALASQEASPWIAPARVRLAEIALHAHRAEDCLHLCRLVIRQPGPADMSTVLRLMGQAYELTGDHFHAARCFAGLQPE